MSGSKPPQVSRTLLSILLDLNNVVVWMVSTRPLISKSSNPFNNPLVTVPKAPITIGIITLNLLFYSLEFFTLMVFHWSLSDSKSLQVSRTRLRILANLSNLSNAVVWIVSTRPPTSKSSRPFNNPLAIVPKAPIIIGTIVIFMFHSRVEVLILLWSAGKQFCRFSFLLLIIMRSSLLAWIR